jgi:phage shock protein A
MTSNDFWRTFRAQLNELASYLWASDPVDQLQAHYDRTMAKFQEGRQALEQHRLLVERVRLQVADQKSHVADLEAKLRVHTQAGKRASADDLTLQLQEAQRELAASEAQLQGHEEAYQANLAAIKQIGTWLTQVRAKIARYDAALKVSRAEADLARVAQEFSVELATDFRQVERAVQERIDRDQAPTGIV